MDTNNQKSEKNTFSYSTIISIIATPIMFLFFNKGLTSAYRPRMHADILIMFKKIIQYIKKLYFSIYKYPHDDQLITLYDTNLTEYSISVREWRLKIIPHNLEDNWNDYEKIADIISMSLEHNIFHEVKSASKYLVKKDKNNDYYTILYGHILMNTNDTRKAEKLFLDFIERNPHCGSVYTSLARVQSKLYKPATALITLEDGLKADPNQIDALLWWVAIQKDYFAEIYRITEERAYFLSLEDADSNFGGWVAKAYTAFYFLTKGKNVKAISIIQEILEKECSSALLLKVSGWLGEHELIEEMIKLVAPKYLPSEHHTYIGLNLLQAYLEKGRFNEGLSLLNTLFKLERHDIEKKLLYYQVEFEKIMKKEPANEDVNDSMVGFHSISHPLWLYGLENEKIGIERAIAGKKIGLLPFSCEREEVSKSSYTQEDEYGRLTRAIPLYILESLYCKTTATPEFLLLLNGKGVYVVMQHMVEDEYIKENAKDKFDGVFGGAFTNNTLHLKYWDLSENKLYTKTLPFQLENPAETIPFIEKFVLESASLNIEKQFDKAIINISDITDKIFINSYLSNLGSHLNFLVTSSNPEFLRNVYGERNMILSLLRDAIDYPVWQTQLSMLSLIRKCMRYNSQFLRECEKPIINWLDSVMENPTPLWGVLNKVRGQFNDFCKPVSVVSE